MSGDDTHVAVARGKGSVSVAMVVNAKSVGDRQVASGLFIMSSLIIP